MNSNRDIFIKRINESHQINNNQKKEPNSVLTNVKTTKSIITPEGKSIFIKEGKNHIQGAEAIVEASALLRSLLIEGEEPSALLYYLGFITLDEGTKKALLYVSKSLNEKTKNRVDKLTKKLKKYPDSLIDDVYDNFDDNEKNRCNQVLEQYKELIKQQEEQPTSIK